MRIGTHGHLLQVSQAVMPAIEGLETEMFLENVFRDMA